MLKRIQVVIFVLIIASASYGQKFAGYSHLEFEKFVTERMTADKIPGLSIGYLRGKDMWAEGFGYADLENESFATKDSMYRLASVTKPMTATAVLQLVEQGKIDLDAEVQAYVPYFPKKKYPVTVRYLLGHLGGISHYQDYDKEGHFKYPKNTRESLAVFQDWDLVAEPGTRFNYTSYGYNLLGAVIEGASGMPYGEYMRKNVWDPLGMETIVMDDPRAIIPNRVRGYELNNGQLRNSEFIDISSRFAAGGTRASVIDMLRFGKGLIDGKVLKTESLELMFDSMVLKNGEKTFYGAGIGTYPTNGRYTLSHSGAQQETATHLFVFPSRDLVIALAINLEGVDRMQFVRELFYAVTGEEWEVRSYPSEGSFHEFMNKAFVFGRAYFEKYGRPADDSESAAIEFLNPKLKFSNANFGTMPEAELAKILKSESTKTSPVFEKVGSLVAAKLFAEFGAKKLNSYSNTGAIGFFADYVKLSRKDSFPGHLRVDEGLASRIEALNASWETTNTARNRRIVIDPSTDLDKLSNRMLEAFAGEKIYPDHSSMMLDAARNFAARGSFEKAIKISTLAVELYPQLDETNTVYGVLMILSGKQADGMNALRRSVSIDPKGSASAGGLIDIAGDLFQIRMYPQGLKILEAANELHPANPSVKYRLGDYHRRAGDKTKALDYFKKALELDPGLDAARKAAAELDVMNR